MKNLGFVLIAVLMVAVLFSGVILHFATKTEVAFTVEHRERVVTKDGSRYMIWGNTGNRTEVFQNVDTPLAWKFNSADLYGQMSTGAECVATVTGVRVPVLSMNRNILRVDCEQNG